MTIALVTYAKLPEMTESDRLIGHLFAERGFRAKPVIWSDPTVRWRDYDLVMIRSAWDSHIDPPAFDRWLDHLAELGVQTLNPLPLIKQNQHKFYLRDLDRAGIRVIPTRYIERTSRLDLSGLRSSGWASSVIKPAISANSYFTACFRIEDHERIERQFRAIAMERELLIQEFMPEIQWSGETSMVFINRRYSHSILKRPGQADFRVQAEYGGEARNFYPGPAIVKAGEKILDQFAGDILYARVDGVIRGDEFYLMEIELTDPELYFDLHPAGREHFVQATLELCGI